MFVQFVLPEDHLFYDGNTLTAFSCKQTAAIWLAAVINSKFPNLLPQEQAGMKIIGIKKIVNTSFIHPGNFAKSKTDNSSLVPNFKAMHILSGLSQ